MYIHRFSDALLLYLLHKACYVRFINPKTFKSSRT